MLLFLTMRKINYQIGLRPGTFCQLEEAIGKRWDQLAITNMDKYKRVEWEEGEKNADGQAEIAVVGDGGWGKRSLGHSYDALTGIQFCYLTLSCQCWSG